MTSVALLLLFRLFFALSILSEYILSRLSFWSFPIWFPHHLMHVRLRIPISCHYSPRSALRLPFLDGFSPSRVVIPVDSFSVKSFDTAHFFAIAFADLYSKQSNTVTLAVFFITQTVEISSHRLFYSKNSSYRTHIKARYAHPRDDSKRLSELRPTKKMRIVHSAK